jgi:hypothetical protein
MLAVLNAPIEALQQSFSFSLPNGCLLRFLSQMKASMANEVIEREKKRKQVMQRE